MNDSRQMKVGLMLHIKNVAVLGTSAMAAQIAAHFVNAGFSVYLFDLPGTKKQKNLLADDALHGLNTLKPSPLLKHNWTSYIIPSNYEDDIEKLKTCDLIIESIPDQLEWKIDLFKRIAPYVNDHCIIGTNTSNLTIQSIAKEIPKNIRPRFCGIHFFNPPRYLPLIELIKHDKTDPDILNSLENFLIIFLGKFIIRARDTPCFIGNRIGMFVLLTALRAAETFDLRLDVVDKLTGPLIGHAKSATLGALDLVGLDTFANAVRNVARQFPNDPWHSEFQVPDYIEQLIDRDILGLKTGMGIYKSSHGKRQIYDIKDGSYRPVTGQVHKDVLAILDEPNAKKRFKKLQESKIPDARFLWTYYRDIWHYTAYHLSELADTVRDIDDVMLWGFAWSQGPFNLWQEMGWLDIAEAIKSEISEGETPVDVPLPDWVFDLGKQGCYDGESGYNPTTKQYQLQRQLPIYQKLKPKFSKTLYEDDAVIMRDDENIAILSFKTKMGIVTQDVVTGIRHALSIAEKQSDAFIIWQETGPNFSVGADLNAYQTILEKKNYALFESRLDNVQACCMQLRYAEIPTVAALKGYVLGDGCEIAMHCLSRVAHIETQMGLVESTLGITPAGGGCKEMVLRANELAGDRDLMQWLSNYFICLLNGRTSSNAVVAQEWGFLKSSDVLIMNPEELLFTAKQNAISLVSDGYVPPRKPRMRVVGDTGWAQMATYLINQYEGGFISEHDYIIGHQLAKILSGGILNADSIVTEEWLMRLEREAFLELIRMPETIKRVELKLKRG